jgi:VWFA-related protein
MRLSNLALSASALALSALTPLSLSAQFSSPTPAPAIRVYAREIVVDVDVTDAKGNAVHNLKQSDFTLLENNQPITPRSFREHRLDESAEPATAPTTTAAPSLPPNTFSNAAPPEGVRPLEILLLDSLDTPIATQSALRQRMVEFVDKLPPGTRVSVFNLSATGQLSMIQGFTIDRAILAKAIKSHKLDIGIPPLEDAGQEPDNQSGPRPTENARAAKAFENAQPKVDQDVECNHAADRVQYTSNAFAQIARYTSGMPGRKNLIWYTGAFPSVMNDKQGGQCYNAREDVSSADDLLEHSHVVVYPVDPRALDALASQGPDSRIGRIQAREHLVMEGIAEQTGGKAFYNNNDLAAAATQAIDAGTNYYTITYVPTNQNFDTRRRNITLTVDQPGLTLVYKRAYNAMPAGRTTTMSGRPIEKATPLQTAMMRGAMQPTEILFHVGVTPAATPDTTLPPGNNPDPKAMKPPYRRLTLAYNIDLNGIQFDPSADGAYHGQFEYAVNVYDSNDGKLVNSNVMAAKPNLPPAVYQSMLTGGAKLKQEIDLPTKGDFVLRIGVHDLTSDRVGAIEIPVSNITP